MSRKPAVVTSAIVNRYTTSVSTPSALGSHPVEAAVMPYCTAAIVRPKQLYAGRATKMHITVISNHKVVPGVRVQIKGPGISIITRKSNARGKITQTIKPKKAGIVYFKPIATVACKIPRVGITGVFTPPVTG